MQYRNNRARQEEKLSTASMALYCLLGVATGVMLASGIMIYGHYTDTVKDQEEYEELAALSVSEEVSEPIVVNMNRNIIKSESHDEPIDYGFDMIATGSTLMSNRGAKTWAILTPIDDPTTDSVLLREVIQDEPAHAEQPEQKTTAEPTEVKPTEAKANEPKTVTITHSLEGMAIDFPKLYGYNPDICGWLKIEGTAIDYPVVQAADNEYYLKRSFYKKDSSAGCLFIDYSNEIDRDTNIVIYGHNMGRSSKNMFSSLINYYEPSYYQTHRYILFDSIYGAGKWEIISVFKYNVENINNFNYTQQQFGSATEYKQYIRKIKELSLYDTGASVGDDEQILTLSTCDRETYGKSGRCVVVAKKI